MALAPRIVGDAEGADEFTPPQMFARETLEYMTFEETGLKLEDLPTPMLWNVLILPKQPKKVSKGGIELPTMAQDVEQYLNYIGQVVALGPLAGKSEKFLNPEWVEYNRGHWPDPNKPAPEQQYLWNVKVGDWVTFGKYAGMTIECRGVKFMNLNDDMITGIIKDPAAFTIYI